MKPTEPKKPEAYSLDIEGPHILTMVDQDSECRPDKVTLFDLETLYLFLHGLKQSNPGVELHCLISPVTYRKDYPIKVQMDVSIPNPNFEKEMEAYRKDLLKYEKDLEEYTKLENARKTHLLKIDIEHSKLMIALHTKKLEELQNRAENTKNA